MPELLSGTVTFLFSDIEGSTKLLRSQGNRWPALLERHAELLRSAFSAEGGVEFGSEGDALFVAFPSAPRAVAGAVAGQRALTAEPWPEDGEIHCRMGMHTGEASFNADGYVGLHVHRASRIAGVANGGQVLLSDTTRSLLADELPDGVELRDLGEHRLKDLEHPEHLWQVVTEDLPSEFPALASVDVVPNNLPNRLTTFLGREHEIGEISARLAESRLLTLTGPGGTGKTRLSLEVAGRSLAAYPGGVFFVELAPITDPDLVPATIAQALGLPDRGGRGSVDRVVDHIGERRVLLVLDNFEQVTDAAPAVQALLTSCPNLTILTSSRAILHVSGEREYPVPPLGLPDPAQLPSLAQLSQFEAVALFIERARAIRPDFEVTNENAPAVAEICVRLDGLPLAIELAAARIRILTPQAMLTRLEHRLGLLAGGSRDLPERQQTLRGAIAWSHDLLDDEERSMFACLSVFVGGANLEAIEAVCGTEVAGDPLDAVASLVEKSLVRQSEGIDGQPRFRMLETIREFSTEQAAEMGRTAELRARHADHFLAFAESSSRVIMGRDKRVLLDLLEQDHDNLRAAMSWAIETDAPETALRMGTAMWRFWQMRGYLIEGLERVDAALAMPSGHEHPAARADALDAGAGLAYWLGDTDRSRGCYAAEIELREQLGDRRGLAEAHYGISFTWAILDLAGGENAQEAADHINQALAIFREIGDEAGEGRCEWALSNLAWSTRRVEEAREHATRASEVFERIDDQFMLGWAGYTLALAAFVNHTDRGGDPAALAEARRLLSRALGIFAEAQDVSGYTLVLDAFSVLANREGDRERAARLSGAVKSLERSSGTGLNPWNRNQLGFDPESLRTDPSLADAWASGEAMSGEEAVAYALEGVEAG